jgi:hypothetical protein
MSLSSRNTGFFDTGTSASTEEFVLTLERLGAVAWLQHSNESFDPANSPHLEITFPSSGQLRASRLLCTVCRAFSAFDSHG